MGSSISTNSSAPDLRAYDIHWENIARTLRARIQGHWSRDTAHPLYADAVATSPLGQCYVSAMYGAHALRIELGLDARLALGSVWSANNHEVLIPNHGWVVVGDPTGDPVVVDLTADQTGRLPGVLAGRTPALRAHGATYHYSEVKRPDEVTSSSALQRWLILTARARPTPLLAEFRQMRGLDLSIIRDDDIRSHLEALLASDDLNADGQYLVEVCSRLADVYSFTGTRTYPRPDHPSPRKRRSLSFLLASIIVSLRTTLENEQKATDALLERCLDDEALYALSEEDLAACIAPAGMAATKARRVRAALDHVEATFGRDFAGLANLDPENARQALLRVPGFGPKAADCFLSIGLGIPSAVVDVNVFRSFMHLFPEDESAIPNDYSKPKAVAHVRERVQTALPDDPLLHQIVHTFLLLFAKNRFGTSGNGACAVSGICRRCMESVTQSKPIGRSA